MRGHPASIGAESDFKGVIDLITMKAKGPDDQDIEIPADLAEQAQESSGTRWRRP